MASLFHPTYSRPDPVTGARIRCKLRKWYGKYRDSSGALRRIPLCEDKTAAMAILTDLVRKAQWQQAGLVDPAADHLALPIDEHLADYRVHFEAKARSSRHIAETIRVIRNVVAACGLKSLMELHNAGAALERHLANRRRAGASYRTVNGDLVAVRSFCRWLIRRKRMHDDPTHGLERLNEDEDPRLQRRALTDEEVEKLHTTTNNSKRVFRGLAGPARAMLYLVALRTGLRRGELRQLTAGSFDFAAAIPSITLQASISKRRRIDTLPLPTETARMLQQFLAGGLPTDLIWPGTWWQQAAKMLRLDLLDAGIPALDGDGRVIDFHALRTTFITSLARAGVAPAMAQKLARHSDINLTLNAYTRLHMLELADAVTKLPTIANNAPSLPLAS